MTNRHFSCQQLNFVHASQIICIPMKHSNRDMIDLLPKRRLFLVDNRITLLRWKFGVCGSLGVDIFVFHRFHCNLFNDLRTNHAFCYLSDYKCYIKHKLVNELKTQEIFAPKISSLADQAQNPSQTSFSLIF